MAHLHYDQLIMMTTDASVLGVGGCVANRFKNESGEIVNRIVAVASHAFTDAEGRWKTIEQEGFAAVWMVLGHRSIFMGTPVFIRTNHRNLLYIQDGTSAKITRWSLTQLCIGSCSRFRQ